MQQLITYLYSFLNSFSQVFLYQNKYFGLLIFLSLLIIQPRLGIFSAIAVIFSLFFASIIGVDVSLIHNGIIGFNPVLIGIVCALFLSKNETAFIATIVFSALFMFFQLASLRYLQLPVFTLPFVLTALIVYLSKNFLNKLF